MATKFNYVAAGTLVTDEYLHDVGANAFQLDHSWFYDDDASNKILDLWTSESKEGTQLIRNVDYEVSGLDEFLTQKTGKNTYSYITVINPTYQTGTFWASYYCPADLLTAADFNAKLDAYGTITNDNLALWESSTSLKSSTLTESDISEKAKITIIPQTDRANSMDVTGSTTGALVTVDLSSKCTASTKMLYGYFDFKMKGSMDDPATLQIRPNGESNADFARTVIAASWNSGGSMTNRIGFPMWIHAPGGIFQYYMNTSGEYFTFKVWGYAEW